MCKSCGGRGRAAPPAQPEEAAPGEDNGVLVEFVAGAAPVEVIGPPPARRRYGWRRGGDRFYVHPDDAAGSRLFRPVPRAVPGGASAPARAHFAVRPATPTPVSAPVPAPRNGKPPAPPAQETPLPGVVLVTVPDPDKMTALEARAWPASVRAALSESQDYEALAAFYQREQSRRRPRKAVLEAARAVAAELGFVLGEPA